MWVTARWMSLRGLTRAEWSRLRTERRTAALRRAFPRGRSCGCSAFGMFHVKHLFSFQLGVPAGERLHAGRRELHARHLRAGGRPLTSSLGRVPAGRLRVGAAIAVRWVGPGWAFPRGQLPAARLMRIGVRGLRLRRSLAAFTQQFAGNCALMPASCAPYTGIITQQVVQ